MGCLRHLALLLVPLVGLQALAEVPPASKAPAAPLPVTLRPVQQDAKWAVSWWGKRHRSKNGEAMAMKDVGLVFIGDSITHGFEQKGRTHWASHYASFNPLNLGFSGDRTEHVLWRLQNGALDHVKTPKVAIIMIGTNNTGHRMDPAKDTAAGIRAIVDEVKTRLPETKILLLAIFPTGATSTNPRRVRNEEINAIIQTYADQKSIWFANLNKAFLGTSGDLPKSVFPDLLHPNEEGYTRWVNAMAPHLKQVLDAPTP